MGFARVVTAILAACMALSIAGCGGVGKMKELGEKVATDIKADGRQYGQVYKGEDGKSLFSCMPH